MNKILHLITVLMLFLKIAEPTAANAAINLFEQPRFVPALSFYGDSGKAFKLTDFNSDLLVAVVWSRSCGPCLDDLRRLGKFVETVQSHGIEVILISPDKEWRTVDEKRTFLRRMNAGNMVSFNDRNNRFKDGMGVSVTPTAIVLNKNAEEVAQITGSVKWDDPKVIDYMIKLKEKSSKQLEQSESADKQN